MRFGLGQTESFISGPDLFKQLSSDAIGLFSQVQQNKALDKQIKGQQVLAQIEADAVKAVAAQQRANPIVIQSTATSPLPLIIGGTVFFGVVGGIMYWLTREPKE